jgi:hypothetical protein
MLNTGDLEWRSAQDQAECHTPGLARRKEEGILAVLSTGSGVAALPSRRNAEFATWLAQFLVCMKRRGYKDG